MSRYGLACLLLAVACTHAGRGEGELVAPSTAAGAMCAAKGEVDIDWHSTGDESKGEMRATLPDGRAFVGRYLQMRADVETNTEGPYVSARPLPSWAKDPWYGRPPAYLVDGTSDKAVALLRSVNGEQMRCKFKLSNPEASMAGGAFGTCLLSDKEEVLAVRVGAPHGR